VITPGTVITPITLDPYEILGVRREASQEEIRAAYEQALAKYDADQVAHLSADLQEYYRTKADAVVRAYRALIG
jgi:preprotein translocase subunit Sec63